MTKIRTIIRRKGWPKWHSPSTPPPIHDLRLFVVAIDVDGYRYVLPGRRFGRHNELRAVGSLCPIYAWAYMPPPPSPESIRRIVEPKKRSKP